MKKHFHRTPGIVATIPMKGDLAGTCFFPPFLHPSIFAHLFHIGCKIISGVFEITEEVFFPFQFGNKNRKVL